MPTVWGQQQLFMSDSYRSATYSISSRKLATVSSPRISARQQKDSKQPNHLDHYCKAGPCTLRPQAIPVTVTPGWHLWVFFCMLFNYREKTQGLSQWCTEARATSQTNLVHFIFHMCSPLCLPPHVPVLCSHLCPPPHVPVLCSPLCPPPHVPVLCSPLCPPPHVPVLCSPLCPPVFKHVHTIRIQLPVRPTTLGVHLLVQRKFKVLGFILSWNIL